MGTRLFDLLVSDLPFGFARSLLNRVPLIYAEAFDSVTHDTRFGEPEMRYMHGHTRRALMEAGLREIATSSSGMAVEMRRAEGVGGPEHVMVTTGRFCFTSCHLTTPSSFPKESRHREQYSAINEHVAQGELFPVQSEPEAADIYGIIIHCETLGEKGKVGTLCIGFPNKNCDNWIEEPIQLADLADAQDRLREPPDSGPRSAEPTWKKRKDHKEGDGA